jgi:protease IV
MRSFFKTFFAALLALVVFSLLIFFFLAAVVGNLTTSGKPSVEAKSVLVIDLGQHYSEQVQKNAFGALTGDEEKNVPGLYDVIRLLEKAKTDADIAGIYIQCNPNSNGFAASDEIRNALLDFKSSKKFVFAFGDVLTQKAYHIANTADKIYISPQGYMEWNGFSVSLAFLKGTLDKLDIQPQIFYAGKFKSATEPLRATEMTPENELQTSVWLGDLYNHFLVKASEARKIDTAELRRIANTASVQNAKDAVDAKLADALKYDDEVKDEIKIKLGLDKYQKINFVSINTYAAVGGYKKFQGEKIAVIYAEGDIVDGGGNNQQGMIAADDYRKLIRKVRLDKTIKAIVFRINSGGGSSLASETIWRELSLAKKDKPVVISFGDVAASGGYYIACAADSIFANPTTITGSIGVFGIIPNMEGFFKNKLGVTFDGVKTGPYADAGTMTKPMNENEKKIIQVEIDNIYTVFKQRVADARKKDPVYIDSIAQGRVWTGKRAIEIGLIDKFGGINDAVQCAARLAKVPEYYLREYPEPVDFFDQLFGKTAPLNYNSKLKAELGEENFKIFNEMRKVQQMSGKAQTKLPFSFSVN